MGTVRKMRLVRYLVIAAVLASWWAFMEFVA